MAKGFIASLPLVSKIYDETVQSGRAAAVDGLWQYLRF
jgi:hypothetical protein